MSLLDTISSYLPTIENPKKLLTLRERIMNTLLVIALYTVIASIPLFGISPEVSARLEELLWLFGSNLGTLASVGIAPPIVAGIFMQLLVGMKIIDIDISKDEGKEKFDNYTRAIAFFFIIIESLVLILSGNIAPNIFLGINPLLLYIILFIQLVIGGIIILLLDDFCYKYGITSGINIIILTVISIALALRLFNPLSPPAGNVSLFAQPTGYIPAGILYLTEGNINLGLAFLFAAIATFGILIFAVYLQSLKVDVPLLYFNINGEVIKYPIQLLYTSVIPAIFIYALIIEVQSLFGFNPNNPIVQLLSPPNVIINLGQFGISWLYNPFNIFHIIFYFLLFVIGGMFISKFWIHAIGMDPKNMANYLTNDPNSPMYMRDPRIVEDMLRKYIDPIGYLSGFLMGLLASLGDILSSAVSGVSILLLIVIAGQIYNDMKRLKALHLFPLIGKYLSKND
ncbi:protein translocase subunit SecY [Nanoarchaeota archaeon]